MTSKFTEASLDTPADNNINYHDDPPPVYSGETAARPDITVPPQISGLEYLLYRLPNSTISDDQTTRHVFVPPQSWSAENLKGLVKTQATLPPRPVMRIRGTHVDKLYSWGTTKTDFDVTLDLTALFTTGSAVASQRQTNTSNDRSHESSVKEWEGRLQHHLATSVILERKVSGYDHEYFHDAIRSLVRSTSYQGDLSVTFPVQHAKVIFVKDTQPPSSVISQTWLSRTRSSSAATSSAVFPADHVSILWHCLPSQDALIAPSSSLFPRRQPSPSVSLSSSIENIFINTWRVPILNAVLARRTGWITLHDWHDAMIGEISLPLPLKSWGTTGEDLSMLVKGLKEGGKKKNGDGRGPGNVERGLWLGVGVRR